MEKSDAVIPLNAAGAKHGRVNTQPVGDHDVKNRRIRNSEAREQALTAVSNLRAPAVSVVEYISRGRVVVFADVGKWRDLIAQLADLRHHGLVVATVIDPVGNKSTLDGLAIPVVCARVLQVTGYLGAFDIVVQSAGGRSVPLTQLLGETSAIVDVVVDLLDSPALEAEVLPPGYLYAGQSSITSAPVNATGSDELLETLQGLVGEFDKPRYFSYNPNICVHGRAGKTVCTRCIDACPTLAITSLAESVEVDPHLCQGGGSCAAACPSGAIRYDYPTLDHVLTFVKMLLKTYRANQGTNPRLVFYESTGSTVVKEAVDNVACHNMLPLMMEEVGAVGMECILASLAYGAQQVVLLYSDTTPPRIRSTLQQQIELINVFLRGMGYAEQAVVLCSIEEFDSVMAGNVPVIAAGQHGPADFMAFDDKRTMIYRALEHLNQNAPNPRQVLPLPEQAPFGRVYVDRGACTLCFACASVCPVQALQAGGEQPRLNFIEDNCVQCGLCEQSCPEQAISLESRFVFSATRRKQASVLNEEQPFDCIRCGKPFTTRRMLDHMIEKLSGHWMFKDKRALSRLKMCENCRVEDMYVSHQQTH